MPNTATPLGLHRPLEKSLEDKILRGEYINFCLLLPDFMYRSQAPALQLRYEDSSPGSQGSPLTLVRRKKPVIDTFQKWLDAFTAYMLVIVAVHPTRALELLKYQQTISKAVSKFKGLAWLSYDEQFRRRAAYDLSKPWDKIDLELWTVTFSGLGKPHCSVWSSRTIRRKIAPTRTQAENLAAKSLSASTLISLPVVNAVPAISRTTAVAVAQATTPSSTAPVPNSPQVATDQATQAIAARNKVVQRQLDCNPTVSTRLM